MEETQRMAAFLFEMADLRREDIDVAELYDHFGPLVLLVVSGPIAGVRVVELGGGVSCAVAGKWLAVLGAEVIRVEPAGGDPAWRERLPRSSGESSARRAYLDAGKRSVALDLASAEQRKRLAVLLAGAGVVVDGTGWCGGSWVDPAALAGLPRDEDRHPAVSAPPRADDRGRSLC